MPQRFAIAAAGLPRSCAAPAGGALSGGRGRIVFRRSRAAMRRTWRAVPAQICGHRSWTCLAAATLFAATGSLSAAQAPAQVSDATASLTQAQSLALTTPSGRVVKAIGYVADRDSQGPVLRARYHAPDLTGADDIDSVLADMAHLCETDALAQRDAAAPSAQRIIVSFSAKPLALSQIDASVVQYFEIYRVENGRCIWELF